MLLSLLSNVLPTLVVSSRGREQNCDRVTRRFARLEEISVEFIQLAPSSPLLFLPNRDLHATRCPRGRTSPLRFTRWRGSRGIASFFSSFFLQRILVKGFFFTFKKEEKRKERWKFCGLLDFRPLCLFLSLSLFLPRYFGSRSSGGFATQTPDTKTKSRSVEREKEGGEEEGGNGR